MPVPVLTTAEMREWEAASWRSGLTETEVIQKAAMAVAQWARQMTCPGARVLVLAGKGNNGADARLAGAFLPDRRVDILNVTDPESSLPTLDSLLSSRPDLIIDGLFGIGLNRPLNPAWCALLQHVNDSIVPVLSVDVPSGLHADLGQAQSTAIQASMTLTIGAPKQGMLIPSAGSWVGRLECAHQIGLIPCPFSKGMLWGLPSDFIHYPSPRPVESNKGTYGHAVIVAGSMGYHGAAVLAARGALRARPGLVTIIPQASVYQVVASQLQAAMVHPWHAGWRLPGNMTALLYGPGLADTSLPSALWAELRQAWQTAPIPVIVDASALDRLPPGPISTSAIRLITPHPGEAARLLHTTVAEIQADRSQALQKLSAQFGDCWVILKGRHSLVGRSSGQVYINPSGNPYLAQGGSGDILAGYLAGLSAQSTLCSDPLQLIRYAVWQHGATADLLNHSRSNWTVDELVDQIGMISAGF
jgi:ADP-dependent NAD(P)H-hydrate dehydratase / NAD(P)H-hydrate epimerase